MAELAYAAASRAAERNRLKTGAHVGSTPTAGITLRGKGSSFNGRILGLHPGDEGSSPSGSTNRIVVAEGRDGDLGGLISLEMRVQFPPPRPLAGSFNGRTAVLQAAHGGSTPSPATKFDGERKTAASSIPAAHPNSVPRVVG